MSTTLVRDTAPDTDDEPALLAWLAAMREQAPVWRDRYGSWHVFRHDDVLDVLRDLATFSSDFSAVVPSTADRPGRRGVLTQVDPPEHRSMRRVVSAAFTPRTVASLEPRIRSLTAGLLDQAGTEFDLVDAVAFPLPVTVIADLLGLPPADHPLFRAWADRLFSIQVDDPTDPTVHEQGEVVRAEITEYLAEYCRSRRAHPGDDLMSGLVTAEVDGERLDDAEAANFSMLLLLAGHITTTTLLGNAVRTFDEAGAWAGLRADPSAIPAAVEEVLRLRSPFVLTGRTSTREVEVAGTTIPAHAIVLPWLLSANHDPAVYPDPERYDPSRGIGGGAQVAFGHGTHFCLGAPLARLEARVVLEEMTSRFAALTVAEGDQAPYTRSVIGTRKLPVAATRSGSATPR